MGDAVFKLFAYLGINTDDYNEGLEQSEKKGANFGAGIKKAVGIVGTAIAGATTAYKARSFLFLRQLIT